MNNIVFHHPLEINFAWLYALQLWVINEERNFTKKKNEERKGE